MKQHTLAAVLIAVFASTAAWANTVDFTQVSIGPQSIINYQGVTISGLEGTQVSTVAGTGLGVGSNGSLDYIFDHTFSENKTNPEQGSSYRISVDGHITSITLAPYMIFEGPEPAPGSTDFVFSLQTNIVGWGGSTMYRAIFYPTPELYTLAFPDCSNSGIEGADCRPYSLDEVMLISPGQSNSLRTYEVAHMAEEYKIKWGFALTSLDYTPTHVPEPSSLILLCCGVLVIGLLRRRRAESSPAHGTIKV